MFPISTYLVFWKMERFFGKVAIVTGSSAGIGAAICKELVKRDVIVVGLARRIEKLEILAKELSKKSGTSVGKFYPLKCDVTKETDVENSFKWASSTLGPVAILINNAGILRDGLKDATAESISETFDTNVNAAILFSNKAIKCMTENSIQGHIININSVAGHSVFSGQLRNKYIIYKSSKHALKVISEGLRRECADDQSADIKVTNLSPGSVYTEVTSTFIPPSYSSNEVLKAEDIANACISVLNTPPNVLISELTIMPIHQRFK